MSTYFDNTLYDREECLIILISELSKASHAAIANNSDFLLLKSDFLLLTL